MNPKVDKSLYQDFLKDLGVLIKELAFDAKQQATQDRTDFVTGYLAGFHRVVSLMQQQAEAFDIPVEEIGLDAIEPDEDLV